MPGKHLGNLRVIVVCCRVVKSSQKPCPIKVESLRVRVSHDPCRKLYCESPQALTPRNVAAKLLSFEVPIRENKWCRDVIPDQVAKVVRELQLIPSRRLEPAAQRRGRAVMLRHGARVLPFQRYPIRPV